MKDEGRRTKKEAQDESEPGAPATGPTPNDRNPQSSALSTQHSALSPQPSVLSPQSSVLAQGDVEAVDHLRSAYGKVRKEIARVIVGQDEVLSAEC